ncbi:hypothetical protein OH460_07480 [Vibrio sp. Makdt]|uniref:hypothetical protein n=1 Tax=Vibrio sp. Makdt TaxID=2998828 RepID=UPI0022CD45F8|nr:hypothetical protein [Vibrio sp. Makdt]MDA0152138.1 hypothetical protein [Vibrio sp. Makdt]
MEKSNLTEKQLKLYQKSDMMGAGLDGRIATIETAQKTTKLTFIAFLILGLLIAVPALITMVLTLTAGGIPTLSLFFSAGPLILIFIMHKIKIAPEDAEAVIKVLKAETA